MAITSNTIPIFINVVSYLAYVLGGVHKNKRNKVRPLIIITIAGNNNVRCFLGNVFVFTKSIFTPSNKRFKPRAPKVKTKKLQIATPIDKTSIKFFMYIWF